MLHPVTDQAVTFPADAGFGIYVHWPFCARKCPYCDFNSHVREAVEQVRWRSALLTALDRGAEKTGGRTVTSIFFGGGTPSLMPPETVAAVLDHIASHWVVAPNVEISLEANPGSVEVARFRGFRAAGVNRVSIGVQSLDDAALAFLGRVHSAAEARQAIETAASVFDRYSIDLIYALPGQSLAAWSAALSDAMALAGDHISAYQLTIEQGTAFHTLHRTGRLVVPDEDLAADLYACTQDLLGGSGFDAYEVSNHARPGNACRHNLTYWRYGDYLGIGPGAHGRLTIGGDKFATTQRRLPERWLQSIDETGDADEEFELLPPERRVDECAMMGLRLNEGVSMRRLADQGSDIAGAILASRALDDLIDGGFLFTEREYLKATAQGRLVLNAVIGKLLGSTPIAG